MRILLTGASGFFGGIFCRLFAREHEITALEHRRPAPAGVRSLAVDLCDEAAVQLMLAGTDLDAVVHAAALSSPNQCQQEPERSRLVNLQASARLAECCARLGLPLVFLSTDLVFDGTRGLYREDDMPAPLSVYGEHKALAERAVLARHPEGALICRLPLLYGCGEPGTRCFLDGMLDQARQGATLRLFTDEFRSPLHAEDAARGVVQALSRGTRGILHLGGPERLSRHDFGLRIKAALAGRPGWPRLDIEPARQADAPMPAPRPRDVSLDSSRAAQMGFRPARVDEALPGVLSGLGAALAAAAD